MKSATLTAVDNQAALLINLESQRQIPVVFKKLAEARSGLWPKHLEGSLIQITSSKGVGELLKLFGSLSDKGYAITISDEYESLEAERKARIEAIEARKLQDAIPPMEFANKRFSFRWSPRGLRVTFASISAFQAWASGHQIEVLSYGKHHAYLPRTTLPRLNQEGIFLKPLKLPACPAPLAMPRLSCPALPLPQPQPEPQPPAPAPTRPAKNATKAEWGSYALFLGIDEETLVGLKRDQIIEECDLMEAAASI